MKNSKILVGVLIIASVAIYLNLFRQISDDGFKEEFVEEIKEDLKVPKRSIPYTDSRLVKKYELELRIGGN